MCSQIIFPVSSPENVPLALLVLECEDWDLLLLLKKLYPLEMFAVKVVIGLCMFFSHLFF